MHSSICPSPEVTVAEGPHPIIPLARREAAGSSGEAEQVHGDASSRAAPDQRYCYYYPSVRLGRPRSRRQSEETKKNERSARWTMWLASLARLSVSHSILIFFRSLEVLLRALCPQLPSNTSY